ncbi:MAG: hypothetical protein FWE71_10290 [Nocardioidaceae bacterium]|nr:hypothetical protein [Nocardioidaceae bacterium]MCL2614247.1 hypothetical protein [Nocardioidaceae bacterium]
MSRRYRVTTRRRRLAAGVRGALGSLARPGSWSAAWVVVWIVTAAGSAIVSSTGHGPTARRIALACFVGLLAGCVWQWLNRRDLVDRFVVLSWLAVAAIAFVALWPGDGSIDGDGAATAFGVLAGNVLLEWWLRLPAQRSRYGEPPASRVASDTTAR